MVEHCFNDCIKTFRSSTLSDQESKCVNSCAEKFIKLGRRAGYRYQEHQYSGAAAAAPKSS